MSSLKDLAGTKGSVQKCPTCKKLTVHFQAKFGTPTCGTCGYVQPQASRR